MELFDITFHTTMAEIETKYPLRITENLRSNADKSRIAIINGFREGDYRYDLALPKRDSETGFYYTFLGEDALAAKNFITGFLDSSYGREAWQILLIRQEPEGMSECSFGVIDAEKTLNRESIKKIFPDEGIDGEVYALPLKLFWYPCPVCGKPAFIWRGMFEICEECGWEDDGENDENTVTTPNGDYTIRTYRKKYLKLKKENPDYKWWHPDKQ